jgi:hypothetical protein
VLFQTYWPLSSGCVVAAMAATAATAVIFPGKEGHFEGGKRAPMLGK